MTDSSKWIATIPTPSLANAGKIDIATDLLAPYSDLMVHFLANIDLHFVRDNEHLLFTKAKPYQTKDDYNKLFESCKKRYAKQLEKGQTPKRTLNEQLKAIEKSAIQTPLSARYVQTCYKQTLEIYSSWLTSLEDKVRSFLGNSSIINDHFLATCYRINKLHLWYHSDAELNWYQTKKGDLLVPSKKYKANVTLPVSSDILFFMRKLIKRARKCIRFPQLKRIKTLKLDENVAVLEVSKKASHFDYFLKLSTLHKGKPIYLPLKRNPYLDDCLKKGERLPFVQVRLTDKTCTISAIVSYDKAPLRSSTESIGLDFGMVSMFTTSDGERHGLSSFTKLKIWDEELLALTKELQEQSIKLSTNKRYNQLQRRIKSYFKNEICRILNKLAKKNVGIFVVEKLDFRAAGLSKRMNRLIGRTYRSVVKAKLARLEEQFGIQVIAVNPAYTSQECSRCHHVSKDNRKTQKDFICRHCHYSCNADVNAGRVINQRRSLMLEFPVYSKSSTSYTVRCQVQEASEECHRRYCHDNGIMTYEEFLAKGSL
jgi:transposase, IS605 orfB family